MDQKNSEDPHGCTIIVRLNRSDAIDCGEEEFPTPHTERTRIPQELKHVGFCQFEIDAVETVYEHILDDLNCEWFVRQIVSGLSQFRFEMSEIHLLRFAS